MQFWDQTPAKRRVGWFCYLLYKRKDYFKFVVTGTKIVNFLFFPNGNSCKLI